MELYKRSQETSSAAGLYLLKKLKLEHVRLTSYSRMRVDLAAQVLIYLDISQVELIFITFCRL